MIPRLMANPVDSRPADAPTILVDALNVAFWCGSPASLRLPIALLYALLAKQQPAQLYFDASTPYQLDPEELEIYVALLAQVAWSYQAPSGTSADSILLQHARRHNACIVSRDRFRDHRKRYRKLINEPGRVVSGWVEQDVLQVPDLSCAAPLAATTRAAWQLLIDGR